MSQLTRAITNNGPSGFVQTLTGNSGGAVYPLLGNINLMGSGSVVVAGNPATGTLTISSGGQVLTACFAATTSNLTATYNNGASGVGATLTNAGALAAFSVDGQSPLINARILVKNQSNQEENGIYSLSTVGDGITPWVLTRTTDFDQPSEIIPGSIVAVQNGTVNANTVWVELATVTTVGTDPIIFSTFSNTGVQTLNADTGSAFGNTILIAGGQNIATSATGSTLTVSFSGVLPVANGGTGTSTQFTQGSVVFAGASGVYSQDNSAFFWDPSTNRLGVGTNVPKNSLDIAGGVAVGSYAGVNTAPSNGMIISGQVGINTSSVNANNILQITNGSTYSHSIAITGTITGVDANSHQHGINMFSVFSPTAGAVECGSILSGSSFAVPAAQSVTSVASFHSSPVFTSNAGSITNAYGMWYDGGSALGGGSLTNNYGGYFDVPVAGTNKFALYADNMSIGSDSTVPPTNGLTVLGQINGSAGLVVTGAAISLNASSNFNTSINTGTSTGAVSIGNNAATGVTINAGTGSFSASSLNNAAGAITINANGGVSETILIRAQQGSGATSINMVSTAGGITLNAAGTTAITNNATIGGTLINTGLITGTSGLSISGGTVDLNVNSNFPVNINSGTSTGTVTIGSVNNNVNILGITNTITGQVNMNTTGVEFTNIGNAGASVVVVANVFDVTGVVNMNTGSSFSTQIGNAAGGAVTIAAGSASSFTTANQSLTFNSGTGSLSISNDASANSVFIAAGSAAKSLTLGSTNTTSSTAIRSGSGGVNINVSNNQPTNINTGTSTGAVSIGNASGGALTVASGAASTVTIANQNLTINAGTGTLSLSDDASSNTVNVATGAAAKALNLGSTNTTSATNVQSGSGAVNINVNNNQPTNINTGTSTGAITIGGTSAGQLTLRSNNSSASAINMVLSNATGGITVSGTAGASALLKIDATDKTGLGAALNITGNPPSGTTLIDVVPASSITLNSPLVRILAPASAGSGMESVACLEVRGDAVASAGKSSGIFSVGGTNANAYLSDDGSATNPAYSLYNSRGAGMYSSGLNVLNFATGGTNRLQINSGGTINAPGIFGTTTAGSGIAVYVDNAGLLGTAVSSQVYKKNILDVTSQSAQIYDLRPVSFAYKDDETEALNYGLIAEEVAQVLPELVVYDKDGNIMTVKYQFLPILMLNEMKKQQTIIDNLLQRIAILEGIQ